MFGVDMNDRLDEVPCRWIAAILSPSKTIIFIKEHRLGTNKTIRSIKHEQTIKKN